MRFPPAHTGAYATTSVRPWRAELLLAVALVSLLPWCLTAPGSSALALFERYALAIPVVCLGFLVALPDQRWINALASANLGVYLVHMLAIRATDRLPGVAELSAFPHTALVYVACLMVVVALRRLRIPYIA